MKSATVFTSLPTFTGVTFFGLEELHLFGQGIAKHVYKLLTVPYRPSNSCSNVIGDDIKKYTFYISKNKLIEIDTLVNASRETIPSTFDSKWKDSVAVYHGNRAVDWMGIFLHMIPTLFVPVLVNKAAKCPLLCLVRACSIILKWEVNEE